MKRLWIIIALPLECLSSLGRGAGLQLGANAKRLWGELAPTQKPKQNKP